MKSVGAVTNVQRREYGGPVTAGQSYLVGEAQAERFVPDAPERKESSAASGASGFQPGHVLNIHTTVNTVDASGFGDLLDKHHRVIEDHVNQALRNSNRRLW
jgi:hypothetical protein